MEIIIERKDNGFVLSATVGGVSNSMVYQDFSSDDCGKDHVIAMLYDIISALGESGSKHDLRRIAVGYTVGNGRKLEDAKKGTNVRFFADI